MLFHMFSSQCERRNFGGSDFIEIQYCRLPQESSIQEIVSEDLIEHWKNDSLYVYGNDMEAFYQSYESIFTGGIYSSLSTGPMDLCGINFYSHKQADLIQERIKAQTPPDRQVLLEWLKGAKSLVGFYLLGL